MPKKQILNYKAMNILKLIEENKTNNFKNELFGTSNSKLKKQNVASFDLPQGHTCPFAGECLKFCYAAKGSYRYPAVKNKYARNYEASLRDDFVEVANNSIKALPNIKFFRIHTSGDYYNKKYIQKWIEIAKANKDRVFYSYTKSVILFKGIELPENLIINQSEGTKKDSIYIDYSKTFVRIFDNKLDLMDAVASGKFLDASENDLESVRANLLGLNVALLKH
jgi:hypothetical protein